MLNSKASGFCPGLSCDVGLGDIRLFCTDRLARVRGSLGASAADCVV